MTGESPSHPRPPQPGMPCEVVTLHEGTDPAVLEQAFSRDSLYQLRATVAAHAAQAGMPASRTHDVVLAVYELVSNVIRHGSGEGQLRIWKTGQSLSCAVTAAAPAPGAVTAAESAATACADPAPWPVKPGHGLWLVIRLTDQATFEPGPPSRVTISFALGAAMTDGQ